MSVIKKRRKITQETVRTVCSVIAVSMQIVIAIHLMGGF